MSSQTKRSPRKGARTHRSASADASVGSMMQSALFGALIGLLSAALLLFAATAVCYATADPAAFTTPSALVALYLASLVAGFAALRKHRSMALACGSLCGFFLLCFFLALSLVLQHRIDEGFSLPVSLLIRGLMIPTAALGGYLGLPRSTQRKRRAH